MSISLSRSPVFIIGSPRSGNTLIAAILAKHPAIMMLFEKNIYSADYRLWLSKCNHTSASKRDAFIALAKKTYSYYHQAFDITDEEIAREITKINSVQWNAMLSCYMEFLTYRIKPGARYWGDKTPHHIESIEKILNNHPDAKFIYVERDPRAVVASLSNQQFPHSSNRPLVNASVFGRYWSIYQKQKMFLQPHSLLEVRYERLVEFPSETLHEVCSFLDIDFQPDLLLSAPTAVRSLVEWWYADDKAWDEIRPQEAGQAFSLPEVEWQLRDEILGSGYELRYGLDSFKIAWAIKWAWQVWPFLFTSTVLGLFWKRKYPRFEFLLQKIPSISELLSIAARALK